jgi:hypothetical protein
VILFDTSLSMQWEKLERSYQALESLLRTLRPSDRFNLLLFNNQVETFQPAPVAAEPAAVQHALDFVRSSKLRGGTGGDGSAVDQKGRLYVATGNDVRAYDLVGRQEVALDTNARRLFARLGAALVREFGATCEVVGYNHAQLDLADFFENFAGDHANAECGMLNAE